MRFMTVIITSLCALPCTPVRATMRLPANSVSGYILDEIKRPVAGAEVTLKGRRTQVRRQTFSNDEGRFFMEDLTPDQYMLNVSIRGFLTTQYGAERPDAVGNFIQIDSGTRVVLPIVLQHGASISGLVRFPDGAPAGGASVTAFREVIDSLGQRRGVPANVAISDDRGRYEFTSLPPDRYWIQAAVAGARALVPPANFGSAASVGSVLGVAPTFHPSVLDAKAATTIEISDGEVNAGIDVLLVQAPLGTICGSLSLPPTATKTPDLQLSRIDSWGSAAPISTTVAIEGSSICTGHMAPGEYLLRGRISDSQGTPFTAVSRATVDGPSDVRVPLIFREAATLEGVANVHGQATDWPDTLWIELVPLQGAEVAVATTSFRRDGSFRLQAVQPGRYRFRLVPKRSVTSRGWKLDSAIVAGVEVADSGFEVAGPSLVSGVKLTLTQDFGTVNGLVLDARGDPTTKGTVIVFPRDKRLWPSLERRISATRPTLQGAFETDELAAGAYFIAAVESPRPNEWLSGEFLATVVDRAVPITIADGRSTIQNLVLMGPQR